MRAYSKASLSFSSTITLNEAEIRALDALIGYGTNEFIEAFYKVMGRHYLQPYEKGLRSLFTTISKEVRPALNDIEEARRDLNNAARKRAEQEELQAAERRAAEKAKQEAMIIKVLDPPTQK